MLKIFILNVHFDIMQAYGIHCNFFVQPVCSQLIRFDNVLVGCWWQHYTYLHTHIYLYTLPDCSAHTKYSRTSIHVRTIYNSRCNANSIDSGCLYWMHTETDVFGTLQMHSPVAIDSLVGPNCVLPKTISLLSIYFLP